VTRAGRLLAWSALALIAAAAPSEAKTYKREGVTIEEPSARPSPFNAPAGPVGGEASLSLANEGTKPVQFLGASSPAAGEVELHQAVRVGKAVRTRRVLSLSLNPGDRLVIAPDSEYRLIFVGLKHKLKDGDSFPLVLEFDTIGSVEVTVEVKAQVYSDSPSHWKTRARPQ